MMARLNVPLMANDGPHETPTAKKRPLLAGSETVTQSKSASQLSTSSTPPGHIGDQICFAIQDDHRIVVGDTIFEGGPGRTWSHDGFLENVTNA